MDTMLVFNVTEQPWKNVFLKFLYRSDLVLVVISINYGRNWSNKSALEVRAEFESRMQSYDRELQRQRCRNLQRYE
jgi:hypothetical protein